MKNPLSVLFFMFLCLPAWAQEGDIHAPSQVPPQVTPEVETGEVPEAEVTIVEREGKTIEKYSVNGQVYMVKVISGNAPPYYLLDLDGDGVMDVTRDSPSDISVPQWVLFKW